MHLKQMLHMACPVQLFISSSYHIVYLTDREHFLIFPISLSLCMPLSLVMTLSLVGNYEGNSTS